MHIRRTGDVRALNVHTEIPGLGFLPVNAFVLHAEQPAVIGTGPSAADKDFASALYEVLDPTGVRSRCITHPDATNQQILESRSWNPSKVNERRHNERPVLLA
jgi:hypothetical protein